MLCIFIVHIKVHYFVMKDLTPPEPNFMFIVIASDVEQSIDVNLDDPGNGLMKVLE